MSAAGRPLLPVVDRRIVAGNGNQSSCYFRSGPTDGHRKALIKVTDRCDLHCAHCFVSAGRLGADMPIESFDARVLARLMDARVRNVTLTGGEPFVHPQLLNITRRLVAAGMDVTICTNAVGITREDIRALSQLGRVRVNVSLDGFSAESHGRFRGDRTSFATTLRNARRLGRAGLLKGILCTPNALAGTNEYVRLQEFAANLGADYLLMNPLSSFGRGIRSRRALKAADEAMRDIQRALSAVSAPGPLDVTLIRFPGQEQPLAGCIAGDILYVFVNGDIAVCPYLVFATANPGAQHSANEFIVGNLFRDEDIAARLDAYNFAERYLAGKNATCTACGLEGACGKGCPAAVVASGGRIGDVDVEVCPTVAANDAAACS